jgi:hypothetical protein
VKSFGDRIRKRAVEVEKGVTEAVRKAALAIDRRVVFATPVDTGRARANWRAALGGPFTKELDSTDAGAAISQAQGVIAGSKPGQAIYISNNVPYIVRLNEGSSAQAPAGFVEDALLAGAEIIRKAKVFS